jgi:polyketide-type polyunsaturated fatty acid synthase PfaA
VSRPLDIAIVGLGALFPGRGTTHGFWRDITEGVDTLRPVPESHWQLDDHYDPDPLTPDKTYGGRGGFIDPVPFDPLAHGIPPAAVAATDTSQILGLMVADALLNAVEADSGGKVARETTSCVLGVASATELVGHMSARLQAPVLKRRLVEAGLPDERAAAIAARVEAHYSTWSEATFPGMLGNVVAGRIANRLDLGGSNYVTDAACASSLSALQIACHELVSGDSDMVITGGVDALNDILMFMCFSKTPALSPTGDCRPFSDKADGTMLGEGVGLVALKRLGDAERDGNRIHAVIKGLGGGSDGRATAIYAPLPEGQARAIQRAYDKAGYRPETVRLMEAHGTGTKAGDAAEISGLKRVFDSAGQAERPWCALGSVKSQIGHTKAAAGAASLIKAALSLSHKVLPPTVKVEAPAPALEGSPFSVSTTARPWVSAAPRRASVSSFGFGGSNFHVTLEEYTGPNAPVLPRTHGAELLLVSDASGEALAKELEALAARLVSEEALAHEASESHLDFTTSDPARAAIVATSPQEARDRLQKLAALARSGETAGPLPSGCSLSVTPVRPGKLAFLFPGQGSQFVGMGAELAMAFPAALAAWDLAAAHPDTGPLRLHELAFPPTAFTDGGRKAQADAVTALAHAQPAIAAATLAHLAVFRQLGLTPDAAAGHSFGEIMALHAAGAFDAETALAIARARAGFMADAAAGAPGAMLAVQAGAERLAPHVSPYPDVTIANDNAPNQVVLSGPTPDIDALQDKLAAAGLKATRLPVASAFHSGIVASAEAPFRDFLSRQDIGAPSIPVFANTTAAAYPDDAAAIPEALARQIREPVRFREMVATMADSGVDTFLEVGPGRVVSTLARQCLEGRGAVIIASDRKGSDGLAAFLGALGELSVRGHDLDLAALYADRPAPPPPAEPPKHAIWISGANQKPNLPADPLPKEITSESQEENLPMSREPDESQTAIERIYADMSARHAEFMQMASAAHAQFLNASSALLGGQPSAPVPLPQPQPLSMPTPAAQPPVANGAANGHAANGLAEFASVTPSPASSPAPQAAAPAPASAPPANDARALVTAIVAEKTGYPEDMLDADMDLEAELGVDSIKQVEILSAVRDARPDLPEIDPSELAELRSIGRIAAFIGGGAPAAVPQAPAQAPQPATNGRAPQVANGAGGGDLSSLITGLIAEKTGYPEDMLDADMDLEAELGVDSIKQVEILSALREARPDLPDIDPSRMGELRSIRSIADFFA